MLVNLFFHGKYFFPRFSIFISARILVSAMNSRLWRQISQSKTGWPFEQKRENARRSPTGRSHLTDTLSPVHQHHDCASPTCLQHPTCRWSRPMECIWTHHIFCLQNPGSCEQGRAVDKWLGSSDQWSEDSGHSFLPFHLQRKSRHKAWRQDTAPSGDSHLSRGKAWHPTLIEATHRGHGEKKASRSLLSWRNCLEHSGVPTPRF